MGRTHPQDRWQTAFPSLQYLFFTWSSTSSQHSSVRLPCIESHRIIMSTSDSFTGVSTTWSLSNPKGVTSKSSA